MQDLKEISNEFSLEASTFAQAPNSILSQTYILDDRYILRSRKLMPDTVEKLERETVLISAARPLTEVQFPELLRSRDGSLYIIRGNLLWTAYPLIEGDVLCSWWNLELLNDEARENLYFTLKELHTKTTARLPEIPWNSDFLNDVKRWLAAIPPRSLNQKQRNRLEEAVARVERFEKNLLEHELCFIHGDYHPGNIVFKDNKVIGLIDVDWSRKGYYMEDLSYTLMTLMRDFRQKDFEFDEKKFNGALMSYGLEKEKMPIFIEYMFLAVFYDFFLYKTLQEVQHMTHLAPFQLSFLDALGQRW